MPSKLALNGINLGALIAAGTEPKLKFRDIGEMTTAVDGTTRVTRSARKVDTEFKTVPLSMANALAWKHLITGEGEVWPFDATLYSSKGTPPSANTGGTFSAGSAQYGAGKLSLAATSGVISFAALANSWGKNTQWTVGVWRNDGSWKHHVIRSDGTKWLGGVVDVASVASWFSTSGSTLTLTNATGSPVLYDDLVVLPFLVPDDWPAQWFAAGVAWGLTPTLIATGGWVNEQSSRLVVGKAETSSLMRVASGVLETLDVELVAQ